MEQKVGSKDARLTSKGCLSCIRMKVKCDGTKPQCQRCQQRRRPCPGYRDPNSLVFRAESFPSHPPAAGSSSSNELVPSTSLTRPVSTDWGQLSVSHFFSHFVLRSENGFPGFFEFLPSLYTRNSPACFRAAVDATSLAHLALVRQMGNTYIRQARVAYGRALHQLAIALGSNDPSSPAVLGTIAMLWQYDIIMGEDHLLSRSPHRKGQLDVLRVRLSRNLDRENWINRSVLAGIHMQQIGMPNTPSSNFSSTNIPSFIGIRSHDKPALSLLQHILPQVSSVTTAISEAFRDSEFGNCLQYVQQLGSIYAELKVWEERLSEGWRYATQRNPEISETVSYPQNIIVLPNISTAGVWTSFWLARLSVIRNLVLVAPAAAVAGLPAAPISQLRHEMLNTVNCICSSIPYMLGDVESNLGARSNDSMPAIGAMFGARALFVCAQVPGLHQAQMDWILRCMCRIGHEKGIRQSLLLKQKILDDRTQN